MAKKNVSTALPQSYAITKSTPTMVALLRETFSNNKGKLFDIPALQRLTGKKWVNGFIYYTTRETLNPNAPESFPLVSIKKGRKVVGYIYKGRADEMSKFRNAKGHVVKPDNVIGKWESKLVVRAEQAEAEAAAAKTETQVAA
jgi:hypothetical protein